MSKRATTVLVVLRDGAHPLVRLLALCHRRGWTPVSLRSVTDGTHCEVTMRLSVPGDRRGTDAQVQAQIARLVDVEHVAVDTAEGLPDDVAFAAVRRKAAWVPLAA
jgi:acetolactate synthase regulatory subunit